MVGVFYWLLKLCRWLSPRFFSWFKPLPKPPGKQRWTIYLLNLVFPGSLVVKLIWGNPTLIQRMDSATTAADTFKTIVTYSLFAVAVLIMARQAYLLRDEDTETYRKGLRTARAVNSVVPGFLIAVLILGMPTLDMNGPPFDALHAELSSAIGVSALLAAYVGSVPERIAAQKEARSRRLRRQKLLKARLAQRRATEQPIEAPNDQALRLEINAHPQDDSRPYPWEDDDDHVVRGENDGSGYRTDSYYAHAVARTTDGRN
ncbi:hypothetical protein AB4Y86_00035 [Arthrobacter sp. 2YAF22_2]|uniref:hypothetical protein n=1 Tax=Arthrobacter sp. 2YAF22_2 TaxID=3233029 RepID=UPI003F91700E